MAKKITKWEPEDFELEMTTHWSFPKRGDWATHDAKWRGNWSPDISRSILCQKIYFIITPIRKIFTDWFNGQCFI